MRHRRSGYKLGRPSDQRRALRRSLITDLLRHERIRTTRAKAASIRGEAERLITAAKRGNASKESSAAQAVHARRRAATRLNDAAIVRKLFDEIAPRFLTRAGGYTRVVKVGPRLGDAAEVVLLELVEG